MPRKVKQAVINAEAVVNAETAAFEAEVQQELARLNAKKKNSLTTSKFSGKKEDRPKETHWLNVGIIVDGEFYSLSLGIPVSQLKESKVNRSSSPEWRKRAILSNMLMRKVLGKAEEQEPGDTFILPGLSVQLRAVHEEEEMEEDENASSVISQLNWG